MPSNRAPANRMTAFNLRAARVNEGLSPEALGQKIGVSGGTIRRLEQGLMPTPATARKIAQYLGKEVSDLWPELVHGTERAPA
jgi:transcriptional regulator with XRE-family HTH domain